MTGRGAVIQGSLAVAALAAAYLTWQREPGLSTGEVIAVDLAKSDLEKVRYEDKESKSWVALGRGKDDNGSFVTVHLSGSDSSGVALPSGHPFVPLKVPERVVRANEAGARLYERFAPLRASRSLGVLDAAKLKDLGLDTTKKHLEIAGRGGKRRFGIVPAPPGGNDPYVRDEADGRVYIIARQLLSDLQAASTNLVERRLHSFRLEDVDAVTVTAGAKKKELKASRFEDLPGVRLAPVATPDQADSTAKNWHDRVWNLFPSEVMGKTETPDEGPPVVAIRIDYRSRGRPLGWVELARNAKKPAAAATESPAQAAPAGPESAYGRSEFTLGWMKLSTEAFTLMTEGESLAGK